MESVLANQHSNFELIVVGQSTNDVTEKTIQPFINDPRFSYIHSNTTGQGISRNIGLKCARGDIVALTDDDCTVSIHWLNAIEQIFWKYPQVSVAFCSVERGHTIVIRAPSLIGTTHGIRSIVPLFNIPIQPAWEPG